MGTAAANMIMQLSGDSAFSESMSSASSIAGLQLQLEQLQMGCGVPGLSQVRPAASMLGAVRKDIQLSSRCSVTSIDLRVLVAAMHWGFQDSRCNIAWWPGAHQQAFTVSRCNDCALQMGTLSLTHTQLSHAQPHTPSYTHSLTQGPLPSPASFMGSQYSTHTYTVTHTHT